MSPVATTIRTGMEENIEHNPKSAEPAFEVNVTEDRMSVILNCDYEFVSDPDAVSKIITELTKKKIKAEPDKEILEAAIERGRSTAAGITDLTIATGKPPEPPVDGTIEWHEDYFTEGYFIDPETKIIDFHRRIGNPSVEENELLVTVTRGKPGRDGVDVYGRIITVRKPKEVSLRFGPNVYWDEKVSGYRAKCPGRVRLRRQELDVDPICYVKNGVGIESGNIEHKGKVIIEGDVEMDYGVEATGDIEIRGLAYASDIVCGGDLAVRGGINGHPSKKIEVNGNILAQYIMNAIVRSDGNVLSNNEIIHSDIVTSGEVNCNRGRIVGGKIHATGGITAGEVGAPNKTKTLLIAGVDLKLQDNLRSIIAEIERLKRAMATLDTAYRKLKSNLKIFGDLGKEKMEVIERKLTEGTAEIDRLIAEKETIRKNLADHRHAEVHILKTVYPGVVIRICDCQHIVQHTLMGPLVARYDTVKCSVELTSEEDEYSQDKKESKLG